MNDFKLNIINFFRYLFRPRWWIRIYLYCPALDKKLNELLDDKALVFKEHTEFRSTIGNIEFWIENHPYGSFTPTGYNGMARRSTVERAMKRCNEDRLCDY